MDSLITAAARALAESFEVAFVKLGPEGAPEEPGVS